MTSSAVAQYRTRLGSGTEDVLHSTCGHCAEVVLNGRTSECSSNVPGCVDGHIYAMFFI